MEIKMFFKAPREMPSQTERNKENLISNIGNVLKIADCANDICVHVEFKYVGVNYAHERRKTHTHTHKRARNIEFCFCSTSVACVTLVLCRFQRKTYVLLLSQHFCRDETDFSPSFISIWAQNCSCFHALARFLYS